MRSVYYNPFGMRLAGMQQGIRDEAFLQDQTRQARNSDYDFQYIKPIELHNLQRNSQFADYADPYLRRNLGYTEQATEGGLYDSELQRRLGVMLRTGDQNLPRQLDYNRYPVDGRVAPQVHAQRTPQQQAMDSWYGVLDQEGITPGSDIANQYARSFEQMYGLTPGYFDNPNQMGLDASAPATYQTTPGYGTRWNPQTGQYDPIPMNPNGYMDFGMQPYAYQAAGLDVQRANAAVRGDYNDAMRYQADSKRGGGEVAPAYESHLGD